ncbi:hypothetical protein BHM03_00059196 [Ensete ventricosum]|nr:hypothetical protein BHM03_00059196 [Ensete ventricosum]
MGGTYRSSGYWYTDRSLAGGTTKIDRRRLIEGEIDRWRSIEGEKGNKKKKRKRRKKKKRKRRKKKRRRHPFLALSPPAGCPRATLLPLDETECLPARGERSRRRR